MCSFSVCQPCMENGIKIVIQLGFFVYLNSNSNKKKMCCEEQNSSIALESP